MENESLAANVSVAVGNADKFIGNEVKSNRNVSNNDSSLAKKDSAIVGDGGIGDANSALQSRIKVCVRLRPLNRNEKQRNNSVFWQEDSDDARVLCEDPSGEHSSKSWSFDRVFGDGVNTAAVYSDTIATMVQPVLNGVHGTALVYGQTSSGKTHTMFGSEDGGESGAVQMALKDLFEQAEAQSLERAFKVELSYVEVYNEAIRDLLDVISTDENLPAMGKYATLPGRLGSFRTPVKKSSPCSNGSGNSSRNSLAGGSTGFRREVSIRDDMKGGVTLTAKKRLVKDVAEAMEVLQEGSLFRHMGATNMNERSSRSHTILTVHVSSEEKTGGGRKLASQFNMVDLAGSESMKTSNATGNQIAEAKNINRSLLALAMVISNLAENGTRGSAGATHVGFRNSKLTRILKPALSGESLVNIVCCISPSRVCVEETRSTLQFARTARKIRIDAKVNETIAPEVMVEKLRRELNELRRASMMHTPLPVAREPWSGRRRESFNSSRHNGGGLLPDGGVASSSKKIIILEKQVELLEKNQVKKEHEIARLKRLFLRKPLVVNTTTEAGLATDAAAKVIASGLPTSPLLSKQTRRASSCISSGSTVLLKKCKSGDGDDTPLPMFNISAADTTPSKSWSSRRYSLNEHFGGTSKGIGVGCISSQPSAAIVRLHNSTLQKKVESLRGALIERGEEAQSLRQQFDAVSLALEEREEALIAREKEHEQQHTVFAARKDAEIKSKQQHADTLQSRLEEFRAERDEDKRQLQDRLNDLQTQLQGEMRARESAEQGSKRNTVVLNELQLAIEAAEERATAEAAMREQAELEFRALSDKCADLLTSLDERVKATRQLEKALDEQHGMTESLIEEKVRLEAQLGTLKSSSTARLEDALVASEMRIVELTDTLAQTGAAYKRALNDLRERLEEQANAHDEEMAEMQDKLDASEDAQFALQQSSEAMQEELEASEDAQFSLQESIDLGQFQLTGLEDKLAAAEDALEAVNVEKVAAAEEHERKIQERCARLEESECAQFALQEAVKAARAAAAMTAETAERTLAESRDKLEIELNTAKMELCEKAQIHDKLEKELNEAHRETARVEAALTEALAPKELSVADASCVPEEDQIAHEEKAPNEAQNHNLLNNDTSTWLACQQLQERLRGMEDALSSPTDEPCSDIDAHTWFACRQLQERLNGMLSNNQAPSSDDPPDDLNLKNDAVSVEESADDDEFESVCGSPKSANSYRTATSLHSVASFFSAMDTDTSNSNTASAEFNKRNGSSSNLNQTKVSSRIPSRPWSPSISARVAMAVGGDQTIRRLSMRNTRDSLSVGVGIASVSNPGGRSFFNPASKGLRGAFGQRGNAPILSTSIRPSASLLNLNVPQKD